MTINNYPIVVGWVRNVSGVLEEHTVEPYQYKAMTRRGVSEMEKSRNGTDEMQWK